MSKRYGRRSTMHTTGSLPTVYATPSSSSSSSPPDKSVISSAFSTPESCSDLSYLASPFTPAAHTTPRRSTRNKSNNDKCSFQSPAATTQKRARENSNTEQASATKMETLPPGTSTKKSKKVEDDLWTYEQLFANRCQSCILCQKSACGSCPSCMYNNTSSTRSRRACVLRVCENIAVEHKAQAMVEFLPSLRGYFTPAKRRTPRCEEPFCFCKRSHELGNVSLVVLSTLSQQPVEYSCLHEALSATSNYTTEQLGELIPSFWKRTTGLLTMKEPFSHALVGQEFFQRWTTSTGDTRHVYGTFTACWYDLCTQCLQFRVETKQGLPRDCGAGRRIPDSFTVAEPDAWGGYEAWRKVTTGNVPESIIIDEVPSQQRNWITPTTRQVFDDCILLRVRGFKLALQAKPSRILGAGLGLFCTCRAEFLHKGKSFVLAAHDLIDLGVYAPHREQDHKSQHVFDMKSLLFCSANESWGFDPHPQETSGDGIFDIADDVTGEHVHSLAAQRSLIVFANEVTPGEVPSLSSGYDPAGSVHYLLGHPDAKQGDFILPLGEEVELKIDYGSTYEIERVRKGYPRVSGKLLEEYQLLLNASVVDFLGDIALYSANQVIDSLEYLQQFKKNKHPDPQFCTRYLTTLLWLGHRVALIVEEFKGVNVEADNNGNLCLNGYDGQFQQETGPIVLDLLEWICKCWQDDKRFRASVSSNSLLKDALLLFLKADVDCADWTKAFLVDSARNALGLATGPAVPKHEIMKCGGHLATNDENRPEQVYVQTSSSL